MKQISRLALLTGFAIASAASALAAEHRAMAPEAAEVYFISPEDGATVSSPVMVKFGLSGMGVAPAGIEKEGTGHHHLLIDTELENYDEAVPSDDNHRHFGGGQTETSVELSPGEHTLQLIVGDQNHVPHDPPVESQMITITVQ
jgi:hypothetical protein